MTEKTSIDQQQSENLSEIRYYEAKNLLQRVVHRFYRAIDSEIEKNLDRLVAMQESIFTAQREPKHLAKLSYSIYFVRKKLSKELALYPFKEHFDVRIFSSRLFFAFGSKSVLSILTHARLKDKYEIFDEEQILLIIKKIVPDVELVRNSLYIYQPPKDQIKTLYFEINKESGMGFSPEEIQRIKTILRLEIKFSVEQLVPQVFMIRNEEEIFKNILTLNREIRYVTDLPQVMISFDYQTSTTVSFIVILLRILKDQRPLKNDFTDAQVEFFPERCQIVRYLRKKYPVEANVFKLKLTKDRSMLRSDMSLNYYVTRQKISKILAEATGEFRDYNGGIIIKQRQAFATFREAYKKLDKIEPELLESFYYSISPLEAQATLPIKNAKTLFQLFLEAKASTLTKASDYFLKFQTNATHFFVMIRVPDEKLKKYIDLALSSLQQVVTINYRSQNTYLYGFLFEHVGTSKQELISEEIIRILKKWQCDLEKRQILRLCMINPVTSLDPRIAGDQISAPVIKMLFEGLMRLNRKGELEYGIAKHVEISPDQKTYDFTLRSSYWSDGSRVSAYDFEYAWKKILSPDFKTPYTYLFYPIKNAKRAKAKEVSMETVGINALDHQKLKIRLEHPSPYFLELTAHSIYSPVNRYLDVKHPNWPLEEKRNYVCNGAFRLIKSNPNEGYELSKNPYYWDKDSIKLDDVIIVKTESHSAYSLFKDGLIHWFGSPITNYNEEYSAAKKDERVFIKDVSLFWIVFNNQQKPFNNTKIRQALSWAIDRDTIRKNFRSYPTISPLPLPQSQIDYYSCNRPEVKTIRELFHAGLEELNLSLQEFPILPLIYLANSNRKNMCIFIKKCWEEILGIQCQLQPLTWQDLFSRFTKGNFLIGGINWQSWYNDPIYTLNTYRNKNEPINFSKWENSKYQEIIRLAEQETNFQKRKSYYRDAEQMLIDEMPIASFCTIDGEALKKKSYRLDHPAPLIDFKWGYFS